MRHEKLGHRQTADFIEVRRGYRKLVIFYLRADLGYDESDIAKAVEIYDFAVGHKLVDPTDVEEITLNRVYDRGTRWFKKVMTEKHPFVRRSVIARSAA